MGFSTESRNVNGQTILRVPSRTSLQTNVQNLAGICTVALPWKLHADTEIWLRAHRGQQMINEPGGVISDLKA